MKNKLYMFLAGLAGVLVLFFSIFKAGANSVKVKVLKKEVEDYERSKKIEEDNTNVSDSDWAKFLHKNSK